MLSNCDAYINVVGGLSLDEPAADLAMVLALASSFRDRAVPNDLVAIGEVGLTGELRPVGPQHAAAYHAAERSPFMSLIACTQNCIYQRDGCCTLDTAIKSQNTVPNDFCANFTPQPQGVTPAPPAPPGYF